jgi:pimeloyl-ACP methyl ester carboxylesterase
MELVYHRAGAGPPLVLLHGIGSRWQVWEPVLPLLTDQRDVIALDLPGFGASPMPPTGTPAGVASLTALVGEFLGQLALEQPHVAGNSLGGWISLELAKQGRVRSAAGLSPAGFFNDREALYARATLRATATMARLVAPHADTVLRPKAMRVAGFGHLVAKPTRIPPADAADTVRALAYAPWFNDTLATAVYDRFTGGEQITVPVTIAWGEKDRLLLPRQAARAKRAIPNARIVTLAGCGHVPTYDGPERVAAVLLEASSGQS